jgi:Protein of unknown function (DUF2934)
MPTSKRNSRRAGGAAEDGTAASVKPKAKRAKKAAVLAGGDGDRRASIALAAYFRSERRGFAPGYELEDWLAAEREVAQPPHSNGSHRGPPEPG